MNTSSLDDQLANAWSASAAHAALDGPPNHEALMRRVRSRRRRTYAVRGTATAVACLALTGGGVAIASTLKGQGFSPAISPSQDSATPTAAADPALGKPVTVLVARVDELKLWDAPDMPGLDSAMLVHFSADRSRVEVVPLVKYAEVDTSGCGLDPASTSDGPLSLVQAFNAGTAGDDVESGLRCVMTAVTDTTGVRVDDFAVTDFAGFVDDVNALGGIDVCVPEALSAPRSHLDLAAGWQTLDGMRALLLARTREGDFEGTGTYDTHASREGRVYAAIFTAALASPDRSLSTGSEKLNSLLDEVRARGAWTVEAVAAPQVLPFDTAVAPWDGNAQAVFDALAADRAGVLVPVGCQ